MYDTVSELLAEIAAGEDTYLESKEAVFRGDSLRFASEKANSVGATAGAEANGQAF